MKDEEIDEVLKRAGEAPQTLDRALLDRVAESIAPSMQAVRPLPPAWVLVLGLAAICVAVAVVGAVRLGMHGIARMDGLERALIFPTLAAIICLASSAAVRERIPASARLVSPKALLAVSTAILLLVFAVLFPDWNTERFVAQGIVCLSAGLLHAIAAAVGAWLLLRRGFAVDPAAAGLAAGTFAGLAGVTMLELHCPNLEAPHVMVWHSAVLVLSGAAGAILYRARPS